MRIADAIAFYSCRTVHERFNGFRALTIWPAAEFHCCDEAAPRYCAVQEQAKPARRPDRWAIRLASRRTTLRIKHTIGRNSSLKTVSRVSCVS